MLARLALLCAVAFAVSAAADTLTWTGAAGDGDWSNPANWSPAQVPQPTDARVIDPGNASSNGDEGVNGGGSITVRGASTVDLGGDLSVGDGFLQVDTGASLSNQGASLGAGSGEVGTATVQGAGSRWESGEGLEVGGAGTGTLRILDGAEVVSGGGTNPDVERDSVVAAWPGSTGSVVVSGEGSAWRNEQSLLIGWQGFGELQVLDGATVSIEKRGYGITIGADTYQNDAAGDGTVLVSGTGSTLSGGVTVAVGWASTPDTTTGSLRIEQGGRLVGDIPGYGFLNIGLGRDADGLVVVTDPGSSIQLVDDTFVGREGAGRLEVRDGATAETAGNATVGRYAGTGTVEVGGAGARWSIGGRLRIAQAGADGIVRVTGGGALETGDAQVGYGTYDRGELIVSGPGSTWTSSGTIRVGERGTGVVMLEAGARAVSQAGRIGSQLPGGSFDNGLVTVTGAGSEWAVTTNLEVGPRGGGALRVEDEARVQVAGAFEVFDGSRVDLSDGVLDVGFGQLRTGSELAGNGIVQGAMQVEGLVDATGLSGIEFAGPLTGADTAEFHGSILLSEGLAGGDGTFAWRFDDLVFGESSSSVLEIGGRTAGSDYDQILATGLITLDGQLVLELLEDFEPVIGDRFQLLAPDEIEGSFDSIILPTLDFGLWDTSFFATTGALKVVPEPATALLGGLGLAALACRRRRQARNAAGASRG